MSFKGESRGPPITVLVMITGVVCFLLAVPISTVLGISDTIPTIIGIAILLVGVIGTLYVRRETNTRYMTRQKIQQLNISL